MVKLRLRRRGRKKAPFYDIIAIDGRARRDGAAIERVGYIDPMKTPKTVSLETDRILYWLGVGAQPTDVVRALFSREGILLRRALTFKGRTAEEIETTVAEHKRRADERHLRIKARRLKARSAPAAAVEEAPAAAVEEAGPETVSEESASE